MRGQTFPSPVFGSGGAVRAPWVAELVKDPFGFTRCRVKELGMEQP